MNFGTTVDNLVPSEAQCAKTEAYETSETNANEVPAAHCDLFEAGLGI